MKFDPISEWLYEDPSEETGSVDELGWYGLVWWKPSDVDDFTYADGRPLDAETREILRHHVGAILREDSQGFVVYNLYESREELDADWAHTLAEYQEFYDSLDA